MNSRPFFADFLSNTISNFQCLVKILPYNNAASSDSTPLDFMYDSYLFEKLL